ncbi:hypothetical protein DFP93_12329 [Aneurinibacillus soli]|uniref:Uncharacterized protein n=1 Tax=Aneurinibacillus soli TaxID=1500254 RepID=A0A0U4NLD2_9BACL|nr:hypothetical protein [Aneurinibacillus soli]PYE58484.1 hypothetical protein DFP93_12329 [Aneurinibacillus soli]BAU29460.1 hypothetical protein CB4_03660 [Aneurinibacillus soli]
MNIAEVEVSGLIASSYPYEAHILHIQRSDTTNTEVITWQFANGELVQLMLYSPDDAVLLSVSPAIVLPEENENGHFFTAGEIKLFLSRIKNHNV